MSPVVSEGVKIGNDMPELTVGVHQGVDPLREHIRGLRA